MGKLQHKRGCQRQAKYRKQLDAHRKGVVKAEHHTGRRYVDMKNDIQGEDKWHGENSRQSMTGTLQDRAPRSQGSGRITMKDSGYARGILMAWDAGVMFPGTALRRTAQVLLHHIPV